MKTFQHELHFPSARAVSPRLHKRVFQCPARWNALPLLLALLLLAPLRNAQARQEESTTSPDAQEVTLKYTPVGYIRTIAIAGEFNRWSKTANLLTPHTDG